VRAKRSTIAIDGPAAAGKTTVSDALARRLGFLHIDTGVMYRAVTWAALARGLSVADEPAMTALAEALQIDITAPTVDDGRMYTVLVDGVDITWEIRTPEVDANVSTVSAYPGVRTAMVRHQRRLAAAGGVVMVGRDIGTVVLPDADHKFYLDANVEERARRRWFELKDRGEDVGLKPVLAAMRRRDDTDSHRKVSPLRAAEDAIVIDTTDMCIQAVVDSLLALVEGGGCPQA
jgi:cytidylate kinase